MRIARMRVTSGSVWCVSIWCACVVCVCKSGRGECRSALACARLGSLYSRAPLARRLGNLTRPWRRAPGCVLARGCLRTLRVRLRRIFPPKASLSSAHFSAIARLPSGASPSPGIPPPQVGSAKGGGIPRPAHSVSAEPVCGRRVGAPPATARPSGVRRVIRSPDTARSAWS